MSRYTSKHFRRLGLRRTDSPKDPTVRRNYPPGVHGPKGRPRLSQYGTQLAEKQKAKILYNVSEKQFRKYYELAVRKQGDTGEILKQVLETRLDNVIYRSGLAATRPQARQMVNHGFFLVNGKKVDIPSFAVKPRDEVSIKPVKQESKLVVNVQANYRKHEAPSWLHVNHDAMTTKIVSLPKPEDAEQAFNPRLIVEFYSR